MFRRMILVAVAILASAVPVRALEPAEPDCPARGSKTLAAGAAAARAVASSFLPGTLEVTFADQALKVRFTGRNAAVAQEAARKDVAALEKKLASLFPDSDIHLIPLSGKLIVRGRSHSEDETQRILKIVTGEQPQVINMLAGPAPEGETAIGALLGSFLGGQQAGSIVGGLIGPSFDIPQTRARIAQKNRQLRPSMILAPRVQTSGEDGFERIGVDFDFDVLELVGGEAVPGSEDEALNGVVLMRKLCPSCQALLENPACASEEECTSGAEDFAVCHPAPNPKCAGGSRAAKECCDDSCETSCPGLCPADVLSRSAPHPILSKVPYVNRLFGTNSDVGQCGVCESFEIECSACRTECEEKAWKAAGFDCEHCLKLAEEISHLGEAARHLDSAECHAEANLIRLRASARHAESLQCQIRRGTEKATALQRENEALKKQLESLQQELANAKLAPVPRISSRVPRMTPMPRKPDPAIQQTEAVEAPLPAPVVPRILRLERQVITPLEKPQSSLTPANGSHLTNDDVKAFLRSGAAEATIVDSIRQHPCRFNLSREAMDELNELGVSESILQQMRKGKIRELVGR